MRKFIAYSRVSSKEQTLNYSLGSQDGGMLEFCARNDIEIVHEEREDHSARTHSTRPGFQRVVDLLRTHPEIEGIVVDFVDRSARNMLDFAYILEELERTIISVREGEFRPDDPGSMFHAYMLAAQAKFYSDQLSFRVRRGLAARARDGHFTGVRPLGYLVDETTVPHSTKQDPRRSYIVRELFEIVRSRTLTLDQARDWAAQRGLHSRSGRILNRSEIHYILRNPAYYGMVRTKDGLFTGKHDPIVSKELFDDVQEILTRKLGGTMRHANPFKGLLVCMYCGRQMTLTQKLKRGKIYRYCHCYGPKSECRRPHFAEKKLSDSLAVVFNGIQTSPDIPALLDQLVAEEEGARIGRQRERGALMATLQAEIQSKADQRRAATRKLLDETIDEQAYVQVIRELDGEIAEAERRIEELSGQKQPVLDGVRELFELLERSPHCI